MCVLVLNKICLLVLNKVCTEHHYTCSRSLFNNFIYLLNRRHILDKSLIVWNKTAFKYIVLIYYYFVIIYYHY